jgi:hypothetical protein
VVTACARVIELSPCPRQATTLVAAARLDRFLLPKIRVADLRDCLHDQHLNLGPLTVSAQLGLLWRRGAREWYRLDVDSNIYVYAYAQNS